MGQPPGAGLQGREIASAKWTTGPPSLTRRLISNLLDGVVLKVSTLSPRIVTQALSGDGSDYNFELSAFTVAWENKFSAIRSIEYPTGDQNPAIVDIDDHILYPDRDAPTSIRFPYITPASGSSNISVNYTVPHTVDATSSTMGEIESLAAEHFGVCAVARWYLANASPLRGRGDRGNHDRCWRLDRGLEGCSGRRVPASYEALGIPYDPSSGGATGSGSVLASAWAGIDPMSQYGDFVFRNRRSR